VVDRRFIFHTAAHGSAEAERFLLLMFAQAISKDDHTVDQLYAFSARFFST
jgi:hypothetical protein